MTALQPVEQEKVSEVDARVASVVATVEALQVRTADEERAALDLLVEITTAKKRSETARKFLTGPLNDHIKAINERFRKTTEPLEAARTALEGKIGAFQREQARLAREAEERAAAERRAAEQAAAVERQRLADEAARAAREAAAAEARRQAEIAAQADEVRQRVAGLSDEELAELALQTDDDEPQLRQAIDEEFTSRHAAREAHAAAEAAREAEEAAREAELLTRGAPQLVAVPAAPSQPTLGGSVSATKRWTYEVTDLRALARAIADGHADVALIEPAKGPLRKFVNDGGRELAGVRIFQTDGLTVRSA